MTDEIKKEAEITTDEKEKTTELTDGELDEVVGGRQLCPKKETGRTKIVCGEKWVERTVKYRYEGLAWFPEKVINK